jgi:uncharacterized protein YdeI (YjbR/CyaY-like superfamily)
MNGFNFTKTLMPVKNAMHRLFVNQTMMKGGKTALGQVATFIIEQDTEKIVIEYPTSLALTEELKKNKMKTENILNIKTRSEWRSWLTENFNIEKEVWLVYAKKSTGEQRIQYNDAVEEALCFGWIDSTNKTLDKDHTIQRFTPRKPKSSYSQPNIERLKWLSENNLIHSSLVKTVQEIISKEYVFPNDILDEIKKDKAVWNNYIEFSEPYKRIRIAYIESARKRPEEFTKRLTNFIEKTRNNKLISGFGGIDKYY